MGDVIPFHWRGCQEVMVLFKDLYERSLHGEIHASSVVLEGPAGVEVLFSGAHRTDPDRAMNAFARMASALLHNEASGV